MTDFLQLPNLQVLFTHENNGFHHVKAAGTIIPTQCPYCESDFYRHGTERQIYSDSPVRGNPVKIEIERKRFRCKSCGKTVYEPLPDMHENRLATERLVQYVQVRALNQTFASLAVEVGLDEKSIRHIFDDHIDTLSKNVRFETPEILGIDDVSCSGSFRCILTNIKNRSLFDLIASCDKNTLSQYFSTLANKSNIKIVVMDPSNTFRAVVKDHLPGITIVADRFHVTKLANDALEKVRRKLWKNLDKTTKTTLKLDRHIVKSRRKSLSPEKAADLDRYLNFLPELKKAYEAKERFYEFYEYQSRQHAERDAVNWQSQLDPSIRWAFKDCIAAMTNWHQEIFNFYDYQVTNAYTESTNRLVKDIGRAGRGYSFEVIRAKLLYNEISRKNTQQSIRRKISQEVPTLGLVMSSKPLPKTYQHIFVEETIEFGPHIQTLCDLIEAGKLQ